MIISHLMAVVMEMSLVNARTSQPLLPTSRTSLSQGQTAGLKIRDTEQAARPEQHSFPHQLRVLAQHRQRSFPQLHHLQPQKIQRRQVLLQ